MLSAMLSANGQPEWTAIKPARDWQELVLPAAEAAHLRAIASRLRRRRRSSLVLLGGPPGTGKTLAARLLAGDRDMPVFALDLAKPRAPDRALEQVLAAARSEGAVVLLAHPDHVLRKRARDTRAPSDSYTFDPHNMLERSRRHRGIVVFETRRRLDPALLDRFDLSIELPFPGPREREKIWRRGLPSDARVSAAELLHLAEAFTLPGAAIRGCCLLAVSAAEREGAPASIRHVARALEFEYRDRLTGEATRLALADLRRRAVTDSARIAPGVTGG